MERRKVRGFIQPPSVDQVRELGKWQYLHLSDNEAEEYRELIAEALHSFCDRVDELPQPRFEVKYPRTPGYAPTLEEDPLNIFTRKCEIRGAPTGKLAGKRAALKDNIAVAGLPMTNGNRDLTSLIPDFDAVVTERLLDSGATIVGKLNQDDYSFAGCSDTSSFGAVRNPLNPEYSAGGSSAGQGAAVRAGYADVSLGVDQAGSGRIPAAWSGACSIKPTHGLVPSFGIFYLDHTLDCICPAARTVEEVALALEVIAGEDPRDPQWVRGPIRVEEYSKKLEQNVAGLTIGIVKEGFGWDVSESEVDEAVLNGVKTLEKTGASVREVSVPFWRDSWSIWMSVFSASISVMVESNEQGFFHNGYTLPSLARAMGMVRRQGNHEMPPLTKMLLIMGLYLRREYDNVYYCKGQNVRHLLREQVDNALEQADILVTPSTPMKPFKLLDKDISINEWSARAGGMVQNTCPLDLTGHPALVMPCGIGSHNLPISIQFIGKHWDEGRIFRLACTYESLIGDIYQELERRTQEVMRAL
jgi:amidase